ncbi:MAG: hypothetical protein B6229_03115 [Spirochaetaceae bacterium 4572_7]|nr:MAG: hypothetical protein B6229_03115 [Spirochaetaceae bacterium 4572_7]
MIRERLSENYHRDEFACKCGCGQDTVDYLLIILLEIVHFIFDKKYGEDSYNGRVSVYIVSGNRCKKHNISIPGSSNTSKHLVGKAVDFVIYYYDKKGNKKYISPREIYEVLCRNYKNKYCFILHDNFVHADVRKIAYRKDATTKESKV